MSQKAAEELTAHKHNQAGTFGPRPELRKPQCVHRWFPSCCSFGQHYGCHTQYTSDCGQKKVSDNDDRPAAPSVRSLDVSVAIHSPDDSHACIVLCGRRLWLTILINAVYNLM